ncbi:hypothetical protein RF11_07798 [Thelohanellus kitauei]|uniref:Uncharacterized protein n=1 Tax=Thelohanellus kitauei TaxID=669202 RepID=A0A0C2J9E1_THEKT|nr:hypothetical protein RF11_07798 [Thelohanellus kitauei]
MYIQEKIGDRFWGKITCKLTETDEEVKIGGCQISLGIWWRNPQTRHLSFDNIYTLNKNTGYNLDQEIKFQLNDLANSYGDKFYKGRLTTINIIFQKSARRCQPPNMICDTTITESTTELLTTTESTTELMTTTQSTTELLTTTESTTELMTTTQSTTELMTTTQSTTELMTTTQSTTELMTTTQSTTELMTTAQSTTELLTTTQSTTELLTTTQSTTELITTTQSTTELMTTTQSTTQEVMAYLT